MRASAAASRRRCSATYRLQLVDLARAGKRVLRLKGGDPFVFGVAAKRRRRWCSTASRSASCPASRRDRRAGLRGHSGHPPRREPVGDLRHRPRSVGRHPGSLDWQASAQGSQVIVIYMGMKHIAEHRRALLDAGRAPGPSRWPSSPSATTADQAVLETTLGATVADIAAAGWNRPRSSASGGRSLMRRRWTGRRRRGEAPRNLDPLGRGRPAESA